MMPMPPGQLPPEDLLRYAQEQEAVRAHHQAIQAWYEGQAARLETEHRERVLKFQAILCRCLQHEPCMVHSSVHISLDGRVL